jgi:hypothetical protein
LPVTTLCPHHPAQVLLAAFIATNLAAGTESAAVPTPPPPLLEAYFATVPSPQTCGLCSTGLSLFPLFWPLDNLSPRQEQEVLALLAERGITGDRQREALALLRRRVHHMQDETQEQFQRLAQRCQKGTPPFTLEQYKYAWALVNSRNFNASDAVWSWGSGHCVLLPLADLLNHASPGDVGQAALQWMWNASTGCMEFLAIRSLQAGEELLVNYSEADSGVCPLAQNPAFHFLVNYGFLESGVAQGGSRPAAAPRSAL